MAQRENNPEKDAKQTAAPDGEADIDLVTSLLTGTTTRKDPIWQGAAHAEARKLVEQEQAGFKTVFGIQEPIHFKIATVPEKEVTTKVGGTIQLALAFADLKSTTLEFASWPTSEITRHEMAHFYHAAYNENLKALMESVSSSKNGVEDLMLRAQIAIAMESIAYAYQDIGKDSPAVNIYNYGISYQNEQELRKKLQSLLDEPTEPVYDQLFGLTEIDACIANGKADNERFKKIAHRRLNLAYIVGMSAGHVVLYDEKKEPLVENEIVRTDEEGKTNLVIKCKLSFERLEAQQRTARMRELFYMDPEELVRICCNAFDTCSSHLQKATEAACREILSDLAT